MSKLMGIKAFYEEVLKAPLRNYQTSWGSAKDDKVFLSIWEEAKLRLLQYMCGSGTGEGFIKSQWD